MTTVIKGDARAYFEQLQDTICAKLEELDGKTKFHTDRWQHDPEEGRLRQGGGITRVLADGGVFEKAGVNTSAVGGRLSDKMALRMKVPPSDFFATGVSLVIHPRNPRIPTVHMNLRYLEMVPLPEGAPESDAWFGGGADLTPYYLDREDARHFHRVWQGVCDAHDPEYYRYFKRWCDDYFQVKHRREARGVGGIFFDYLRDDPEKTFTFVRDVGDAFLDAYAPLVERHRGKPWTDAERKWQLIRRGRYVEFNLVHDRGTLFGLETGGRIESILMSLPPVVQWRYDDEPEPGSAESELLEVLRRPVEWV